MSYHRDLEFAKEIVVLRDAFVSGEFNQDGYIKYCDYGDSQTYSFHLPRWPVLLFRTNHFTFDGVSSFQSTGDGFMFIHDNEASQFWINDLHEHIPASICNSTEETYFQNTLLYSDSICRELLVFGYLLENPLPTPYKYFRMNMDHISKMQCILNRLRGEDANQSIQT